MYNDGDDDREDGGMEKGQLCECGKPATHEYIIDASTTPYQVGYACDECDPPQED